MPVENVYAEGVLQFNRRYPDSALSESIYSHLGDIEEDEDFSAEDLELIKAKDASMVKYWRYLTPAKAKVKKADREELEDLAEEAVDEPAKDDKKGD